MAKQRCSIAFDSKSWDDLKDEDNISKTVNAAVHFYFEAKKYLEQQKAEFILKELAQYAPHEKDHILSDSKRAAKQRARRKKSL